MTPTPEGNAIIYCEGKFRSTDGKTAHGLVRRTTRYRVTAVIDSRSAGHDAGDLLDGVFADIPIVENVDRAIRISADKGMPVTHMIVGLAPPGGKLGHEGREAVAAAITNGLNIDCGLHDFLSEDPRLRALASQYSVQIRDIRKPPDRSELHFFSGKIEQVSCLRVAVLGTDSAVGKRTTAWLMIDALRARGFSAELVGTGQTAWLQGARYSIMLDSLINDFVAGELEHAVWSAWHDVKPDVIVIEGQGSLMNPAFPGGFEILAATRPHVVILQHPPARKEYDDFPGYPLHPIEDQIRAIELISGKPVAAVTINHQGLRKDEIPQVGRQISKLTNLPAIDVLLEGAGPLVDVLSRYGLRPSS